MSRAQDDVAGEPLVRSLYREHRQAVLAYATRLTGDRMAAEDSLQEVLIKAWRHPEILLQGKSSVRAWLLTVTRNVIIDQLRAKSARPHEVPETPDKRLTESDHADQVIDSITVLNAMNRLSSNHRAVLREVYLRGNTLAGAAAALNIPLGTAKARLINARRTLRTIFASQATRGRNAA